VILDVPGASVEEVEPMWDEMETDATNAAMNLKKERAERYD